MRSKTSYSEAEIDWHDGVPYSRQFGDVYFSSDSGLNETQHVFLAHNQLEKRWQGLQSGHFTIAETGFGTGLNFLCAWRLWDNCAPPTARLHFISMEKHPLTHADITQALSLWPQLARQRDQLLAQYRFLTDGFHRLVFDDGRITLTLLIGDVNDMLPQLAANLAANKIDAWFLDGFVPAKNPEMWQQSLFNNMARLSHAETTFATFTSAGEVRRSLEKAGFAVNKVAGFGRKREMLCGQYMGQLQTKSAPLQSNAIVIGGGISGCASAHALASRGWQVKLIERHAALAQEASGNPVGVLYPRLAVKDNALSRLSLAGFLYTSRLLQQLNLNQTTYSACGLLQLAFDARESTRCKAIAAQNLPTELVRLVDNNEASKLAGTSLAHGGLYFPSAGWVSPPTFCEALARHTNIEILTSSCALRVTRKITRNGSSWQVWGDKNLLAEAPVLIIASANDSAGFEQSAHLELEPVRGQMTFVNATTASRQLKTILCTNGYICPEVDGQHSLGATFSPDETSTELRTGDHQANLATLRRMAPELHQSLKMQSMTGRAALRCATSDYLPLLGQLLDSTALTAKPPRHNADPAGLPWLEGLYVNTGHGSKGLITAPLCAEILASMICGEPAPIDAKLLAALDPNRFLLQKMGLKRLIASAAIR